MTRYGVSHTKAGVAVADTVMWQLKPGANDDIYIYEIGLSIATAPTNGPQWRVCRSSTTGTSSTTATPVLEDGGSNPAQSRLDLTWSAAPTVAAQSAFTDFRRFTTTATIANGVVWTWYDKPLCVPAGTGLSIVNGISAGAAVGSFQVYARLDE